MFLYASLVGAMFGFGIDPAAGQPSTRPRPAIAVTAAARAFRPGELVVLTIRTPRPSAALRVRGFDAELLPFRVDESTWRVLVGIDLSVTPGTHRVSIEADPDAQPVSYSILVRRRTFPKRALTVDPAFVTPPPETVERIERETRELNEIWNASASERLWSGSFVRPVPHPANSAFGTHSVFNGEPRSQHSGADFRSPAGEPVKAPNSGRVVLAGPRYFSGNTVVIDHGLGLFSLLAHLSRIDVQVGDSVEKGQATGRVGATGRVTGPHLHWTVRANGARIDPLSLLAVLGSRAQKPRGRTQKLSSQIPAGGMLWSSLYKPL